MLKDSCGRDHTYLRISVTDRCNLKCRYCMPPGGIKRVPRDNILHPEEVGLLAQIFVDLGIRKIRLTGGEPLIRNGLSAILDRLTSVTPQPTLALTTNGLLLHHWIDRLIGAGIRRINISLDTLREDRYASIAGVDGWRQVWNNIEAALQHPKIERVKLNVVMQRGVNDDETLDFARLTLKKPLDVRFIETMPVQSVSWHSRDLVTCDEILGILPNLSEILTPADQNYGPARLYRFPGAPGSIGLISSISRPACSDCNRLRLTAQGTLLRCLFDAEGLNLREAVRLGQAAKNIKSDVLEFVRRKRDIGKPMHGIATEAQFQPCLAAVGG